MNRIGDGLKREKTLRLVIEAAVVAEQHERLVPLVGVLPHSSYIEELRPREVDIWWAGKAAPGDADWVGRSVVASAEARSRSAAVLLVNVEPMPDVAAEVAPWYDDEHLPSLRHVPGVISAVRFESISDLPSHLVLYRLASPSVPLSTEWSEAADSPKSRLLRSRWRHAWRILAQ